MPRSSSESGGTPQRRPVRGVLLDFHGTLAQVEDPVAWVSAGAAECGVTLERPRATVLADRLVTAGRAGGPVPHRVPPHLAEVWAERDLYPHAHRAAYTGLAATVQTGVDGLPDALYERCLTPDGWLPYADAAAVLRELRAASVPVAVVSNIGFDIRPFFAAWGLADLVDAFVLSYEVGRCKPDPGIFLRACGALGVDPELTLMVGDTPADAGAVRAGCAALVLPAADAGRSNGLAAVLDLATAGPA
ncbi:HAD family hydrolase [Solwaraspora sp. WMMD1047]|uniref:HAD family hydrolase n=1 Tax=Solwaraspora sp. WMMD1047 TaxID=3016102 RepID=UPI0024174E4B|nr:HAD family hydrolase [Solwaraspora sp. WMMD1047]MDG4831129.1 HAD family hydrolase [Solwaraspora sp. WMMD1047]